MEITTFRDDLIELSAFGKRLRNFVDIERQFVQGSLVLALSSKFGSGKSTFLKMWKSEFDSEEDKPIVVYLNAWESDYYGDPLFAIVSSLIDALESRGAASEPLVEAAKDVGWFTTAIAAQVAEKFTGINPTGAGDLAEKKRAERSGKEILISNAFSIYRSRKDAMEQLKRAIKTSINPTKLSVLFLVDELDRCRPDYAVSYIETIKHIFDTPGAAFILAADRQHLENSAKSAFGPNLDFEEYYRKFVHREILLPPITEAGYRKLAQAYVNAYLEREGLRSCFLTIDKYRTDDIVQLVAGLRMTPRQIQESFRILGHALSTSEDKKGRLRWCIGVGTIAMAIFKVGNPRIFYLLGSKQLDPKEAYGLLNTWLSLEKNRSAKWWFTLFLTGGGLKHEQQESFTDVCIKAGVINGSEVPERELGFGDWIEGWGHTSGNRFGEIHQKILEISEWR